MEPSARIYVAGHRGLAGSALVRRLRSGGYNNLILRTHGELDITERQAVRELLQGERPEYIFLAAAKVGGILANSTHPAEFIGQNLMIQTNIIDEAHRIGVRRLLFLGSSCIYPKHAPQPMKEEHLLTGPLELTNRPYSVAKIAGIEMCWAYNRQFGTRFLAVMPTNLFGSGDRYDLHDSHVVPALLRKMHEAKVRGAGEVIVWGSGAPRREFLYSDDAADACVFLMNLPDDAFQGIVVQDSMPPIVNVGCGKDITIRELAELIAKVVGFKGQLVFDPSKPDGTPRKLLDTTRLATLGWTPQTPLREGLMRAYRDFSENVTTSARPTVVSTELP
jgi:GDP-L-fucose synthase